MKLCVAAALAAIAITASSDSRAQPTAAHSAGDRSATNAISQFYQSRSHQPLWFGPAASDAPQQLLRLLGSAEADGIKESSVELGPLVLAAREASGGEPTAVRRAEILFSEAFVSYATKLQHDPKVGVIYVDAELQPKPSSAAALLEVAAKAPSLAAYIQDLGWMHPIYAQLRKNLVGQAHRSNSERYILGLNLERARALPPATGRHVVVNTANQRLYMYEGSEIAGEMKVVVGRADAQTPLMNAYIRFAVMNPYWNVPADLVARLAPNVFKRGTSYLKAQGYQVVSDFSDAPRILDPATIDWKAVAAGRLPVQFRQLPGPANSMGRIKFMFPNSQGVWLHDTPSKELFANSVRLNSAGCVRLEDAWRLGSWLFRRPLKLSTREPEQQLGMPEPVPVYITYLTATAGESSIKFVEDVYKRDPPPLQPS